MTTHPKTNLLEERINNVLSLLGNATQEEGALHGGYERGLGTHRPGFEPWRPRLWLGDVSEEPQSKVPQSSR